MKKNILCRLLLVSVPVINNTSYADDLRLVIPQFPPYTSEENNVFSGIGIDLIAVLMKDMGVNYTLRSTPNYARALGEIKRGQADGFFLASENEQRNQVAIFSKPLLINKWSWFFSSNSSYVTDSQHFKTNAKVATIHGSNTNKWLDNNHYNVVTKPSTTISLPTLLLDKNRIDAVFLSSIVFRSELESQGYSEADYIEVVDKFTPFGIYISKVYANKNPKFMSKLNIAILKIQDLK